MDNDVLVGDIELQELQERLGVRIRQLREARGWSQDSFAHLVGLSRAYPYRIETGKVDVKFKTLARIAQVFNMPIHELLTFYPE